MKMSRDPFDLLTAHMHLYANRGIKAGEFFFEPIDQPWKKRVSRVHEWQEKNLTRGKHRYLYRIVAQQHGYSNNTRGGYKSAFAAKKNSPSTDRSIPPQLCCRLRGQSGNAMPLRIIAGSKKMTRVFVQRLVYGIKTPLCRGAATG